MTKESNQHLVERDRYYNNFHLRFPVISDNKDAFIELYVLHAEYFHWRPLQVATHDAFDCEIEDSRQWRVKAPDTIAKVGATINGWSKKTETVAEITKCFELGEVKRERNRAVRKKKKYVPGNRLILHSGYLKITLKNNMRKLLADFWPTRKERDLTHLYATPMGLFIEGELPLTFFPPGMENHSVILRIPQPDDPYVQRWNELAEHFFPVRKNSNGAAEKHFYQPAFFTIHSPVPGLNTIQDYLRGVVEAFDQSSSETLGTMVDEIELGKMAKTTGYVFPFKYRNNKVISVGWILDNTDIRISIGGGRAGEVNFFPKFFVGKVDLEQGQWGRSIFGFVSGADAIVSWETTEALGSKTSGPYFAISQSIDNHGDASIEFADIEAAPLVESYDSSTIWLPVRDGWIAVYGNRSPPEFKVGNLTNHRLREVLDASALGTQLAGNDPKSSDDGLRIKVQALKSSKVNLLLSDEGSIIRFSIVNPMIIANTPSVWLQSNTIGDRTNVPDLSSLLLSESKFESLRFVSVNAIEVPDGNLQVTLTRDSTTENSPFRMTLPADQLIYWYRPVGLPLTTIVSNTAEEQSGRQPDGRRGLFPMKNIGKGIEISFPQMGLPIVTRGYGSRAGSRVNDRPNLLDLPNSSWRINSEYAIPGFVATVIGLDIEMRPLQDGFVRWVVRHAVPALQEVFVGAEMATTTQAGQALKKRLALSQVADADLLELKGENTGTELTGWLPIIEKNQKGALKAEIGDWRSSLISSPQNPHIQIQVKDGEQERKIQSGRSREKDGVDLPLKISVTDMGDSIPNIRVSMLSGFNEADISVKRNGQPLIAVLTSSNGVVTLDGQGRIRSEPRGGIEKIAHVNEKNGTLNQTTSRTGRYPVNGPAEITLEVISLGEGGDAISWSDQSCWRLHDGHDQIPRVLGFPFLCEALELTSYGLTLHGQLGLKNWVGTACSESLFVGAGQLQLKINEDLKLCSIEGKIDWQFPEPERVNNLYLVRVMGDLEELKEDGAGYRIPVRSVKLNLRHPLGLFRLELPGGWTLSLRQENNGSWIEVYERSEIVDSFHTTDTFILDPGKLKIDVAKPIDQPVLLKGWSLKWITSFEDLEAELKCTQIETSKNMKWHFILSYLEPPKKNALFQVKLNGYPSGQREYLFSTYTKRVHEFPANYHKKFKNELRHSGIINDLVPNYPSVSSTLKIETIIAHQHWRIFDSTSGDTKYRLMSVGLGNPIEVFVESRLMSEECSLPIESWFSLSQATDVLVGATFRDVGNQGPILIKDIAFEALVVLIAHKGNDWAEKNTQVVAHLTINTGEEKGESNKIETRLTGSIGVPNRIEFESQEGQLSGFQHWIIVHIDELEIPLSTVLSGRMKSASEIWIESGAIVEHVFQWPGSHPPKETRWQCPQCVRWTNYGTYALHYLKKEKQPSEEKASLLVLDAGAVVAVAPEIQNFSQADWADLAYRDIEISLVERPDPSPADQPWADITNRNKDITVIRLPVAAALTSDPIHTIEVVVDHKYAEATTLDEWGVQWPEINEFPHRPALDDPEVPAQFVYRSPAAAWLNADSLSKVLSDGTGPGSSSIIRPAFWKKRNPYSDSILWHRLPEQMVDFTGFFNDSTPSKHRAAVLLTPYDPASPLSRLTRARILNMPYEVKNRVKRTVRNHFGPLTLTTQLIIYSGGRLRRIATSQLEADGETLAMLEEWGREQLDHLGRFEAGAVMANPLESHSGAFLILLGPRWEAVRRWVRDRPDWRPPEREDDLPKDNRRSPTRFAIETREAVHRADPNLGTVVFAAHPAGNGNKPLPSATIFSITHTLAEGDQHHAKLRPAFSARWPSNPQPACGSTDELDAISFTKFDRVPFQAVEKDEYPSMNHKARILRPEDLKTDEVNNAATDDDTFETLLPPLVQAIASNSRPGERTETTWSFTRQQGADLVAFSSGSAATIDLRRPRARAGVGQSVRIELLEDQSKILDDCRWYEAKFLLGQTLAETPEPYPTNCYGVVTGQQDIFVSAPTISMAETSPAILLKPENNGPTHAALWLVAHKRFRWERQVNGKRFSKTVLFWSIEGNLPKRLGEILQPLNSKMCGLISDNFYDRNLWKEHGLSSLLWQPDTKASEQFQKGLRSALTREKLFILVATYTNPQIEEDICEKDWEAEESPVLALQIKFIDPKSKVRGPALIYTLLSSRLEQSLFKCDLGLHFHLSEGPPSEEVVETFRKNSCPLSANATVKKLKDEQGWMIRDAISGYSDYYLKFVDGEKEMEILNVPDIVCSAHGLLMDTDFEPIRPRPVGRTEEPQPVEWSRQTDLHHFEPIRFATECEDPSKQPYVFDIVARGPEGEFILTEDPPTPG